MPRQRDSLAGVCLLSAWIALACAIGAAPAAGQSSTTTADMIGFVSDSSQAILPGATVTATNLDTNFSRSASTNEEGRFFIPALPIGAYRVTAAMDGFETQTHQRIVLYLG